MDCMYWIKNVKNEHDRSGRRKETVKDECKKEREHGSGERRNEERKGGKTEGSKEGINDGHKEMGGGKERGEG